MGRSKNLNVCDLHFFAPSFPCLLLHFMLCCSHPPTLLLLLLPLLPQVRSSLEEMAAEYVYAMKKSVVDYVVRWVVAMRSSVPDSTAQIGKVHPPTPDMT
jgi:hypothetical protein